MKPDFFKVHNKYLLYTILMGVAFFVMLMLMGFHIQTTRAAQMTPSFYSTDGSTCADISDGDYFSTEYFDPGTEITLTAEEAIDSLYIVWETIPGEWTLRIDGTDYTFGKEGFLHEYIEIPAAERGTQSVTLAVGSSRITIADIYAFSDGNLPDFVQKWDPEYVEADVLLISTHADDEVLFFGGIIPNYTDRGDVRIQVAYFSDFFQSEPYRNHEILNGLWTMGVTHYPQLGEFYDSYSESLEEAKGQFDHDASLAYIVRTIRRFKPQVVIGQDLINGEYGHGGHMWSAKMIAEAIELTGDPAEYPDSAVRYGTWDVPKTYFHLYPEHTIELDARVPLVSFGGKTALEIAKLAYLEHQSQQWCWFYVSDGYDEDGYPDGYEYSCTRYGLYRTLVGDDYTGKDILDNITTYDEQIRLAAQAAEAARLQEQAEAAAAERSADLPSAESVVNDNPVTAVPGGKNTTLVTILIVAAVIIFLIIIGILVVSNNRRKIRERQRRLARRQKIEAARNRSPAGRSAVRSGSRSTLSYGQGNISSRPSGNSRSSNGSYRDGNGRIYRQDHYRR